MSSCGCNSSVFGNAAPFLKFQGSDLIAVQGVNTVERLMLGALRIPYRQLLKGRVVLKPGQTNYLLNFLGMGDNATTLAMVATYDSAVVNEEDQYILWNYYDNFSELYPMDQFMILSGNSTHRIKQLYLTNPNQFYSVTLDVMVGTIDSTYTFFPDTINQSATTFINLTYTSIQSYVVGESIVVNDSNGNPLIYLQLSNISDISRTSNFLTLNDGSLGTILLVFGDESNAAQAQSILSYVLSHPGVNIGSLGPDIIPPVVYFYNYVDDTSSNSYVEFMGMTAGPYDTSYGNTFSTTLSLTQFGPTISTDNLITLLIASASDNRDGVISITTSNILLTSGSSPISSITMSGTYSLGLNVFDLALNNLNLVNLSLTITT